MVKNREINNRGIEDSKRNGVSRSNKPTEI
jgi:hypothetical protein